MISNEALEAAVRASGKQRGWVWDRLSEREREKEIAALKAALAALPAHGYKVLPRDAWKVNGGHESNWEAVGFRNVWDAYPEDGGSVRLERPDE